MITLEQLAICFANNYNAYGASDIWSITGLSRNKITIKNGGHSQLLDIDGFNVDYSIIARPLSDLTEPITVEGYNDGKEFVPIVELVRVCHRTDDIDTDLICIEKSHSKSYRREYRVTFRNPCKLHWDISVYIEGMRFDYIQLLAKWHFWIYDQSIFKTGEIIDINSLK